jgi:hypothetical protein
MRARLQHDIPRSLLRAFGRETGQGIRIAVYSRSAGVFRTSTEDFGADADPAGDPLQDALVREIRTIEPGQDVPPGRAAELVALLCVRQARFRQSSMDVADQMFSGLDSDLLDREKVRALFGPETDAGIAAIRKELDAFWQSAVGPGRGFATRQQLEAYVLNQFKADFGRLLDAQSPLFRQFFTTIRGRVEQAARNAHRKALEENLAPGRRMQGLKALRWRMRAGPAAGLILPDCLAVGSRDDATFHALVYVPGDALRLVLVPLGRDRLLTGMRDGQSDPSVDGVNDVLAACTWDFLVAGDQSPRVEDFAATIGERTRVFLRSLVSQAIEQLA